MIIYLINKRKTEIESLTKQKDKLDINFKEIALKAKQLNVLIKLLKDDGIKLTIIKNYIPIINQLLAVYMESMNFNAGIQFDENFETVIKSRGRDEFTYDSFQKVKVKNRSCFIICVARS